MARDTDRLKAAAEELEATHDVVAEVLTADLATEDGDVWHGRQDGVSP